MDTGNIELNKFTQVGRSERLWKNWACDDGKEDIQLETA